MSRSQTYNFNSGNIVTISGSYGSGNNYYPSSAPTRYYPDDSTLKITAAIRTNTNSSDRDVQIGSQSGSIGQGSVAFMYLIRYGPDANNSWKTYVANSWSGYSNTVASGLTINSGGRLYLTSPTGHEDLLYKDGTKYVSCAYTNFSPGQLGKQLHLGCGNPGDNYRLMLKASITYTEYSVGVSADAGGTASITSSPATISSNSTWVRKHESVTVTATVDSGYEFDGWYEGTTRKSIDLAYTFTCGTADHDLTAKFNKTCTLTLTRNNTSAGTVSGAGTYLSGTSVTALASTNSGYAFVGWYSDSILKSSSTSYIFTITDDTSLEATWIENYTLILDKNISEAGTVSGGGIYESGSSITVISTTNTNYIFIGWYKDNTLQSSNTSYTFTLNENTVLEARWIYVNPDYKVLRGRLVKSTRVINSEESNSNTGESSENNTIGNQEITPINPGGGDDITPIDPGTDVSA